MDPLPLNRTGFLSGSQTQPQPLSKPCGCIGIYNSHQPQNNGLFTASIMLMMLQIIQQLLSQLEHNDTPKPEAKPLELSSQEQNAAFQALFNGNPPTERGFHSVIDKDGSGTLSVGDTIKTVFGNGQSGTEAIVETTVTQDMVDYYNNALQAQAQPLDLSQEALSKISNAMHYDVGYAGFSPSITSITDNDGSGTPSPGDTVNIERRTGEIDENGQWVTQQSSFMLTEAFLEFSEKLNTETNLYQTLEHNQAEALRETLSTNRVAVFDTNNDGQLSVGDEIFTGSNENMQKHALTQEQLNAYNNALQPQHVGLSNEAQHALTSALFTGAVDLQLDAVIDNDRSGSLSVGDTVRLSSENRHTGEITTQEVNITSEILERYNNLTTPQTLELSINEQNAAFQALFNGNPPSDRGFHSVIDKDGSGTLSVGDTIKTILGNGRPGHEPPIVETTVTQEMVDYYNNALQPQAQTLDLSRDELQDLSRTLNTNIGLAGSIGGHTPYAVSVTDVDNSGTLSAGDILNTELLVDGFNPEQSSRTLTGEFLEFHENLHTYDSLRFDSEARNILRDQLGSDFTALDADRDGEFSVGDIIHTSKQAEAQTVTPGLFEAFKEQELPVDLAALDQSRLNEAVREIYGDRLSIDNLEHHIDDIDNDGKLSAGDLMILHYNFPDDGGIYPAISATQVAVTEELLQKYHDLEEVIYGQVH